MTPITIVGAGFSGLAAAYFAHEAGYRVRVVSRDPGASGVAVGLLHPFAGRGCHLNKDGVEALEDALRLLSLVPGACQKTGQLRLITTEQQRSDFEQAAKDYAGITYWDKKRCQERIAGLAALDGIFIEESYLVDCPRYLTGLTDYLKAHGVIFETRSVTSLDELPPSTIILATGASPLWPSQPITPIKGQTIRLTWPDHLPPLAFPLNSRAYIAMDGDNKSCWVGATFERHFSSMESDPEKAYREIMPHASALLPDLATSTLIACQAAVRASGASHTPHAYKARDGLYILGGMGSKGLLYHALFAKRLLARLLTAPI